MKTTTETLDSNPYISLRTYRKNGNPVDTPVWFAGEGQHIFYVFSARGAGKVKRLRNNSTTQLATCDMRGGSVGDWMDCEAFIVSDSQEIEKGYRIIAKKYGWQMKLTNFFSMLSGRINQRELIRLEIPTL